MLAVQLRNAGQMITHASATSEGIELAFADGARGIVPFSEIPEIGTLGNLADLELPNAYVLVLKSRSGDTAEIPWDFARHYCDTSYRPRVEAVGEVGRKALGARLRALREATGTTQEALAAAASTPP